MDHHNHISEGDAASGGGDEGRVEGVGDDDGGLQWFDLPVGSEEDGGVGGEVGRGEVDLVFEGDGCFWWGGCAGGGGGGDVGEVEGVFARAGGERGDEGGVRGDFFEDGEVFQADGFGCCVVIIAAGGVVVVVVHECQFANHDGSGDLTGREPRADGFDDGGVEARLRHFGMFGGGRLGKTAAHRVSGTDGTCI